MIFTAICGSIFSLLADMPRDYYPNSLEGKNGAELKTELHNLLKNHTRLPYGSRDYNQIACTWTVFKKSDVRPNKKYGICIPTTLITFRTEQEQRKA